MMSAGRRDLQRAFRTGLRFYIGEVAVQNFVQWRERGRCGARAPFGTVARDCRPGILQRIDRVQFDALDKCSFLGISARYDQFGESGVTRAEHHRKNARDGPQRSVEREFAERHEILQRKPVDLLVHRDERERDREIERGTFLAHVGRREIDEQPARREHEA